MCGICGIASTNGQVEPDAIRAMRDTMVHRGPDGEGVFVDQNIGLGHRRLSIVDTAHGQQPMFNEDNSIVICYNGEIYNHADYREALEARGHRYRTHCDTETIVHLYEEYGDAVVERLRGMFAFAIWDGKQRRLLIARDRLGIKPLYYYHAADGSLVFGSEIKSILASRLVQAQVNTAALPDFLANHATSGTATLFADIHRLEPGHTLVWQNGEVTIRSYWTIADAFNGPSPARSDAEWIEAWYSEFRKSVKMRLMADVPLGMFLSGGIDSSAIAAVMSTLVEEPIQTFSVAFAEREANELSYARLVADKFGTEQHETVVTPKSFFDRLPDLVWHEDEPIAHPSSVALYFVAKLAAQNVKVVLTGEGSDEMLGGYERYRKTLLNLALGQRYHGLTNEGLRQGISTLMNGLPSAARNKLTRTFFYREPNVERLYFDNFAVFSTDQQSGLLSEAVKVETANVSPYCEMNRRMNELTSAQLLDRLLYVDTNVYLQELLMKQDQMSMAASLESRVPFLDHKLSELSASLPSSLKIRGWTTKKVLREAMRNVLPAKILSRSKMGFPVPLASWFRTDFRWVVDEYLLSDQASRRGYFDKKYVRKLVDQHASGQVNNAQRIWALINFEIWMRRFIDQPA